MLLVAIRLPTLITNYNKADRIVLLKKSQLSQQIDTKLSLKQNLSKTFKPDIDVNPNPKPYNTRYK